MSRGEVRSFFLTYSGLQRTGELRDCIARGPIFLFRPRFFTTTGAGSL